MRASYQKLLGLTRGVVRQSQQVLGRFKEERLPVVGSRLAVFRHMANLEHFLPRRRRSSVRPRSGWCWAKRPQRKC